MIIIIVTAVETSNLTFSSKIITHAMHRKPEFQVSFLLHCHTHTHTHTHRERERERERNQRVNGFFGDALGIVRNNSELSSICSNVGKLFVISTKENSFFFKL
jgi:hypothetical protein